MSANPNWARWIFASLADHLKAVAVAHSIPVLIEGFDERTAAFEQAGDKVEIRITGPFTQEFSGCSRLWVDANVLLTSRYEAEAKNAYTLLKNVGLFHEAMSEQIPVWNYGHEMGDYVQGDPSTHIFLGCLSPRTGINDSVRVLHFGQIEKTDKIKQSAVDARYYLYITEAG